MNKTITITANPNIALVKYWGKRDSKLMLPLNSSISMTLSGVRTITHIKKSEKDSLSLNGIDISKDSIEYQEYTDKFLKKIRELFPEVTPLKIVSENNFPTGAGIASSASGFAALALGINELFQLQLSPEEISKLARLGSGSATRSILGGFNYWLKGEQDNGKDSAIKQIASENHWPELNLAIAITSTEKKPISSRTGMSNTVKTSPEYQSLWLGTVEKDLETMEQAILSKDFSLLGKTAESSALKMHQTMRSSVPPIDYFNDGTKALIEKIKDWREAGELESYFTIDAGPQVKILYLSKDKAKVDQLISDTPEIKQVIHSQVGGNPQVSYE